MILGPAGGLWVAGLPFTGLLSLVSGVLCRLKRLEVEPPGEVSWGGVGSVCSALVRGACRFIIRKKALHTTETLHAAWLRSLGAAQSSSSAALKMAAVGWCAGTA